MTALPSRWFAFVLLPLLFVPVFAAEPDDKETARLIKQLGDDDFEKREAASKRLAQIGEPALDALRKAAKSNDPEVRRRAEQIIAVIENKVYGAELVLTGHTNWVYRVCVSADGKRLLTTSVDKTLRLWDADTGKLLQVFEGNRQGSLGAALSPDGKRALSGDGDTVRLWDATTGKELLTMTEQTTDTYSVCFGPKGKALSGGVGGRLLVWDLKTGKKVAAIGHTGCIRIVAYSEQAKLAATASYDESVRLWDLETGKMVREFTGHTCDGGGDVSVCFAPDGKRVLSSSLAAGLRLWDVATGKELLKIKEAGAYCTAFSPDGKRIVTGGYQDQLVRVWDAETGKEVRKYEGHTGPVLSVAYFPDGNRIASAGGGDHAVRLWRAPH